MKVKTGTIIDMLSHLRDYFQGDNAFRNQKNEEPFRSELYNSEQMDKHGKVLANSHKLLTGKSPDKLLKRLEDNEDTLLEVRNLLVDSIRTGKAITPAAEWLLDNFYLIEEQIVIARRHLPKGYSEALPYLSSGTSAGMPRVYDIVLEIISHSDGRVDIRSLSSFIAAYQTHKELTLGELWALPIMLRLAVIENLRRVAGKIALDMIDHNLADYWADKMIAVAQEAPNDLILITADMARSKPILASPFVAGFTRKLQGKGPVLALPLRWMEQQLSGMGINSEDLVHQENQKQAADQVSVRNSIGTLRFLEATDWRDFVESLSTVERVLRKEKAGIYPLMDFATRDKYRHIIESIAKASEYSETEVAYKVVELAESHPNGTQSSSKYAHVGYYLVDKGLAEIEKITQRKFTVGQKWSRIAAGMPLFLFLFSITLLTLSASGIMTWQAYQNGAFGWKILAGVALVSALASSQLSVSLVNWIATIVVKPTLLPRMDFSEGIPVECRTLVVVPTMLAGKKYIEELVEALEIRFLANKVENVHYGLLTDFLDSATEHTPEDEELLELASASIEALNLKYKQSDTDIFFLFHRPRKWNPKENKWMGYERKRGKLSALNALILQKSEGEFSLITGEYEILHRVKYVITLDSDTQLPRDSVWKFVATMAHPLNQAVYDPQLKRVTEGYGILQPRLASSIPQSDISLYLRMQGDVAGIDPYTQVSSDVYQDLFGEGSYIGKGIYDVSVFEEVLHDTFPENRILSHDLVEGCYTRSGLLSDVLVYEENPSRYEADVKRRHRWIRGDWQIAAWIFPFVSKSNGKLTLNKLSTLSRWKILDNLRRSLIPLSLILVLLAGWTILPMPWFWTLAVTFIVLLPVMIDATWQLIHKPEDMSFRAHLKDIIKYVRNVLIRFMFDMAVLPYEAYKYTHAVIQANWRMLISRRKLLEWVPSATTSGTSNNGIWGVFGTMIITPLLALVCAYLFWRYRPEALIVAFPILILWFIGPGIAWKLSLPEKEKSSGLNELQMSYLNRLSRKTWAYFETFVNETENWLPPDNFQEQPHPVIAHRTSPTNLGMSLLSNLAAYDFGYIGGAELLSRCNNSLQTMMIMERYKGHFYNWYDTQTLSPLHPRYVSTVDSGNLAGHLLTLRQGLLSLPHDPVVDRKTFEGILTTVEIVRELSKDRPSKLMDKMTAVCQAALSEMNSLKKIWGHLNELAETGKELSLHMSGKEPEAYQWTKKLSLQIEHIRQDLIDLVPWLSEHGQFTASLPFDEIPSLMSVQGIYENGNDLPESLKECLKAGNMVANQRIILSQQLAAQCEELSDMEYDFLYDNTTSLLRIGFNVDELRRDDSFYDLLASEARLGIFVAIAQGKLPQESWFALGRLLTDSGGDPILLSWSGTMFEYLMPQLVMPVYENTLLHQTNKATVKRQIDYAGHRGVPWGISESAYNMVDASLNYQYRAFGVPGLGLKRGLEEDLVIAPYASMMALMVSPDQACVNLQHLSEKGFEGEYGFYEAIDYTPARLPRGKTHTIINSFMVHHQGMGLLSLAYLLLNKPMQQRFMAELRFQATILLLQERIPRTTVFYAHTADISESHTETTELQIRNIPTPNTQIPEIQLLSNGRYQVMVTNSGGGYSRWKDIVVTRWREDTTQDNRGIFCYIKDVNTGNFWSNTHQPTLKVAKSYEALFFQGHAEFHREDFGIETKTEIVISPEDDTEMRRVRIKNKTQSTKILEITSYAEIVMASQASDEAHPAFSNLFVQTEILEEHNAILCTRRPRSEGETPPWMFHLMDVRGGEVEGVSYETDRMQFTGRGKTLARPQAMEQDKLSGKQGSVLDPILSIRYRIVVKPNQATTIDLIYGISETKEGCLNLLHKYLDRHLKKRAFELSWTHSQVLLRQINATDADAQLYDRLAASVIYANPVLRADPAVILNNYRGQSGLWSHSVSGDIPIVLLHIYDTENIDLVKQMVQAHAYWRLKGLAVDLVIWNDNHGSYRQDLQEQILGLISAESTSHQVYNKPGSIFVKSADQLSPEDRLLFESVARVIIQDDRGTLVEQVNKLSSGRPLPLLLEPKVLQITQPESSPVSLPKDLLFYNGTGGFSPDGTEYKIFIDQKTTTPAPWVNVVGNLNFGSVISESGSSYTWAINAHEYRITPWSNDPVSDAGGEAFYLRDEDTGSFWSPSPFPSKGSAPYVTTHGFGYTVFEHIEQGIYSEMCTFVDKTSPVKFIVLKIRNQSGRERKFSATGFLEIILGDVRSKTNMHILSEHDGPTGALMFRNRYNTAFTDRVTFFKTTDAGNLSFTADRTEFIGRNRNLNNPQAMYRRRLTGRTGAGMDTCAALQVKFDLLEGEEKEIIFQIGSEENGREARTLLLRFSEKEAVMQALEEVKAYWKELTGAVQVETPDQSLNLLANGWLTYQNVACRIFARSGFYQSGGAFGFRDQLQDVLALLHARPQLTRDQILLSASRQFKEGDVQHWWHPPEGRGVRTLCSDDLLWLPFVVSRYVKATGDKDILDVQVSYLESRLLQPGEESLYDLPISGNESGTLYDHCVRAIMHSLNYGKRGLPLIGSGDWNDGMDQVGVKGQGESVWLGFFLYDVLIKFSEIAQGNDDELFARTCISEAAILQTNIETSAWDGEWYKRAWFDDGTPLGSKENEECRIDAIAQSWSVLSGAGSDARKNIAMDSLNKYLVNRDLKLIQLLDPPFDGSGPNPGYIQGYVPGVRENGGQYSHAAIWALMAFAALGDRERVWELFSMIQPVNHSANEADKNIYKVEPYVMAADVYANESHRGRGGWTWYTGSAGWMYQFIIGSLLGLELQNGNLKFKPCFPVDWPSVKIDYRYGNAVYKITVFQEEAPSWWKADDQEGKGDAFPLVDDGKEHRVEIHISLG